MLHHCIYNLYIQRARCRERAARGFCGTPMELSQLKQNASAALQTALGIIWSFLIIYLYIFQSENLKLFTVSSAEQPHSLPR